MRRNDARMPCSSVRCMFVRGSRSFLSERLHILYRTGPDVWITQPRVLSDVNRVAISTQVKSTILILIREYIHIYIYMRVESEIIFLKARDFRVNSAMINFGGFPRLSEEYWLDWSYINRKVTVQQSYAFPSRDRSPESLIALWYQRDLLSIIHVSLFQFRCIIAQYQSVTQQHKRFNGFRGKLPYHDIINI